MQEKVTLRRSNKARSQDTTRKLLDAARSLFVEKGYAETGTPEIVKAAEVTRGALYHHYTDKADLFRAVVTHEAEAIAHEINATALEATDPIDGLISGARGYFTAMQVPGRARLMLVDGPAVLGADGMSEIDRKAGGESLKEGLAAAAAMANKTDLPLDELSVVLSAGFDRAALEITQGGDANRFISSLEVLLRGLMR
ncbi:TetR/AcrR family transcriptional regulator [Pseudovibrio exalbescens]|uniref:TetR/AcrR family transcriptional regulator n=1 Tax=Pseudovibrio exalbescens TaxID=197461 RepID=UPI0023652B7A|nr:TetR/AcrR family transcriptional regulator [Pseudovibrio exalbescens]MDD7909837.1 TetR/AcrR family transcriptional regulator [Pseudovibrio exalbescens]